MVELIESAASAVSSTAAVIIVTVWACSSIAWRMRSAEVWTSSTVAWIEPLASTVWRVACWIAVILAVMSSVARAVWLARLFTSCATTAKPRPASPARAASMVALRASRLVWPAMSRIRPRIDSIASTWPDSAWLTLTAWLRPGRRRGWRRRPRLRLRSGHPRSRGSGRRRSAPLRASRSPIARRRRRLRWSCRACRARCVEVVDGLGAELVAFAGAALRRRSITLRLNSPACSAWRPPLSPRVMSMA